MDLRISFSTLACPDWSWREVLERGPKYGYAGVEIRMLQWDTDLLKVPEFQAAGLERTTAQMARCGFVVCGLSSSVRFDAADERERRIQLETGRAYLQLAAQLGARFVRVFGDVLPPENEPDARNAALSHISAALRELGDAALQHGVDVLIETHGDFADSRLMQLLLRMVNHQAVGVLWDTHHPWRFFGERLADTFDRLKPWVRHTHWKDSVICPARERDAEAEAAEKRARELMSGHRPADYVLFGEGEFPIRECLRLLQEGGYDGWYSLEWEKAWHPELADPEISLPQFPGRLKELAEG